jgi:hypothetical protein
MTMQLLREFSRQEGLALFLDENTSRLADNVQGVRVGYDEYWLAFVLTSLEHRWSPDWWSCQSRTRHLMWPRYHDWFRDAINEVRPPAWDAYCETRGYRRGAQPIIIKVLLRTSLTRNLDLPTAWENNPIVYIPEPPCVAFTQSLNTGDELGQGGPDTLGTLGGILQHRNGTFYLTTAAHVLPNRLDVVAPSPTQSKRATKIGMYIDGDLPAPAAKCNNRSAPNAVSVDIALCEVDPAVISLGAPLNNGLSRWSMIADMTSGDAVAFCGTRTPHGQALINDTTLWRDVDVGGQMRCYGDMFTIQPRHKVYINTNLAQPGDSGAWIVYDGTDPLRAFDGTLIAGAGSLVYCSYAENIKAWCDRKFGANNIILP